MNLKEICILIGKLKEENKTNTEEEREFNNEWIRLLKKACDTALTKHFKKRDKKGCNNSTVIS